MSGRKETATEIFRSGFNCSQGVFTAFAAEAGMDEKTALMLATPFGGGVGGCGETCGAVSGAYMVIGLIHGRSTLEDTEAKELSTPSWRNSERSSGQVRLTALF
ncbi:MAG: C-GCAxxG-C-C family protein [Geovibrio sp.]|nr:C-GCAxxG-C-C family protein [Geovibrio sp.]